MPELTLNGCAPIPLAHYLKALGILRLVSEQVDAGIKGSWQHEQFALHTSLTPDALVNFFCRDYWPSPVLAPWNGGSGFFYREGKTKEKDAATGKLKKTGVRDQETAGTRVVAAIGDSQAKRLKDIQGSITAAKTCLMEMEINEAPKEESKEKLVTRLRNALSDKAVAWLDATIVLGISRVGYPPLLGTGGTDGNLDFTNNFMQRLTEVMNPMTGEPTPESERWLRAALFAEAAPGLATKAPIGQFFPGAAGGANATSGFDAPSAVNPWDFILMIEGALLFAAASVKRLESGDDGALVYPFCVRQAGVGYASAAGADEAEARCEMWMPLWSKPTTLAELCAIFSEGRAQVRGRAARTGVDFAEAAVTLGVDRGIAAFQRYGFQVRNGLAYFATPLDRVIVRRNARADLLADIEQWHDRLRQKAGPRANPEPPASVARALNQLERRIFDLCRDDSPASLQSLLATLGATERALARSFKWTTSKEIRIHPLRGLNLRWLDEADDGSTEFRLAQSIAGMRAWFGSETLWFREHLEPLDMGSTKDRSWIKWADLPSNDVAWHDGDLTDALNAILARRLVRVEKSGKRGWPDWSPRTASLADITEFIEGRTNDALLADLIWGLSLVDWAHIADEQKAEAKDEAIPSSFYALLRLCFRRANKGEEQNAIPLVPAILHRAINGQGKEASILAARRLRASGHAPLVDELPVAGDIARRTAAAMLFPISPQDFRLIERMTLKQQNPQLK